MLFKSATFWRYSVKKKSNLEYLLQELFEADNEVMDSNPSPRVINAGVPSIVNSDANSDAEMSSWLSSQYGIQETIADITEQYVEETYENVEESAGTGVSIKI
jgi:hypothetical protein